MPPSQAPAKRSVDPREDDWASLQADVDQQRLDITRALNPELRVEHGQFFTPSPVARFMAKMFRAEGQTLSLLEPGAGIGSLTIALIANLVERQSALQDLHVTLFELAPVFQQALAENMKRCQQLCKRVGVRLHFELIARDFITTTCEALITPMTAGVPLEFDCIIINPPYRKLSSESDARVLLSRAGVEVTNLYSAFLALAARLVKQSGELVAITPRSFCNGPYFKAFRRDLFSRMTLENIHVYESRSHAFKDDDVLQENIIFRAVKDGVRTNIVEISTSDGPQCESINIRTAPRSEVLHPGDPDLVIHVVPNRAASDASQFVKKLPAGFYDLGLTVSTGRVVDFRALKLLRKKPSDATVPLIYPHNLENGHIVWPKDHSKKACAILESAMQFDLLIPDDVYVLVKRFSAKEEKRRIVAAVYEPLGCGSVGLENHLNYFHIKGRGLPLDFARGLGAYLNSTIADTYFRTFSGHTQVNAGDLRRLRFPTRTQLIEVGRRIGAAVSETELIDSIFAEALLDS